MRVAIALLALAQVAFAGDGRRACRAACAERMTVCATVGTRARARCKRLALRACRKPGTGVCGPPSTSSTTTSTTTRTTLAEPFDWNGVYGFTGTNVAADACDVPTTIHETVTIDLDGPLILLRGDVMLSPCAEGGPTTDGDLACFHDLTPDRFQSARATRPADGQPATLSVGWSTADETPDDCSVRWVGPLVRIGDLPTRRPF